MKLITPYFFRGTFPLDSRFRGLDNGYAFCWVFVWLNQFWNLSSYLNRFTVLSSCFKSRDHVVSPWKLVCWGTKVYVLKTCKFVKISKKGKVSSSWAFGFDFGFETSRCHTFLSSKTCMFVKFQFQRTAYHSPCTEVIHSFNI